MIGLPDIKSMAKALRAALAERGVATTHSECLDLVSRQLGHPNWNTARAVVEGAAKAPALHLPAGWIGSGSRPDRYRMGIDAENAGTAVIESIADGEGFATLMQSIVAEPYLGRRVRLTASLRTRDAGSAAIWLRIDGEGGRMLGFDNLHYRASEGTLGGTHDWTARRIVLAVPEGAASVHYGFMLEGGGTVWARDFRIEAAGDDDAVTSKRPYLDEPTNMDFSRGLDGQQVRR